MTERDRVRQAIGHLAEGEYDKALPIVRALQREKTESPEESRRRRMRELDRKVQEGLGPAAAAYARWQKKGSA